MDFTPGLGIPQGQEELVSHEEVRGREAVPLHVNNGGVAVRNMQQLLCLRLLIENNHSAVSATNRDLAFEVGVPFGTCAFKAIVFDVEDLLDSIYTSCYVPVKTMREKLLTVGYNKRTQESLPGIHLECRLIRNNGTAQLCVWIPYKTGSSRYLDFRQDFFFLDVPQAN